MTTHTKKEVVKTCYHCKTEKPGSAFSKDVSRNDGLCSSCKTCRSNYIRAYYLKNRVIRLAKMKQYRLDHIDAARSYGRAHSKKTQADRRKRSPEKHTARNAVTRAIDRGDIIKKPCETCHEDSDVHAHHEDYSKPLDIVWLCRTCHGKRHREINDERSLDLVGH